MEFGSRGYRALAARAGGPDKGWLLHLIKDGAEASLCGLPRSSLGIANMSGERVCPDCLEWLPKRIAATAKLRRVAEA
ncbi:MAG TPA: hypothetical protein VHO95_06585 [Candidatus Dormibacteraeota bacterium]|nr:hypothetical protein [Candidatus Dormibacteraeota bacterium]